jgi:tetratricopeptide (TPR) repeat protein
VGAQDQLVWIAVLRGRLREAERRYAQVNEAKARVRGDTVSSHDIAVFHAILDGELRGDAARGLATLDKAVSAVAPDSVPLTRDPSLWLAVAYAQLGAPAKARALVDSYERRQDRLVRWRSSTFITRLRGEIAMASGKSDSAITYFHRSDAELDGLPTNNCTVCIPWFLGQAFDRAGKADSARVYLTQYVEMAGSGHTTIDRYWLAPTLYRLGELYENAGDVRHATEYYGRFVDLWKGADPELQPRVVEARGRMERINKANR